MDFPVSEITMLNQQGTASPCKTCRWVTPALTDPKQGRCTFSRAKSGAIWLRLIHDINNTTCQKFEEGTLGFRDNV
ncbi:hypothetical protein DSCO28_15640 [Desulfosarcina ovata subsp. sediminis]|uniref:Benzylsuccinate synthase beta subunit domain-containing protein n=1 Tax=Desulfosarcina ovata subsp. sediminis TaxID=885957 RepID=A0A5K7ZFR2_9BACT|nr:benzylsuccinate synthase beta subunit family protein [Desulfosarcina ovata]BBO80998.1 hypothetical protein DSCO28_15640 [Desulfosarcina ovata subsp. sediminis]